MKKQDYEELIGMCLALGNTDLASKVNSLRESAGHSGPINWSRYATEQKRGS